MKNTKNISFEKLENELNYLETFLSIQSEPFQYNGHVLLIEKNINSIMEWIKKNAENIKIDKVEFIFDLLNKYIVVYKLFFMNHPYRPLIENK